MKSKFWVASRPNADPGGFGDLLAAMGELERAQQAARKNKRLAGAENFGAWQLKAAPWPASSRAKLGNREPGKRNWARPRGASGWG